MLSLSLLAPLLLLAAAADEAPPVLSGLDPVELTRGREVPGDPARALERDGLRYAFASEESRAAFTADPERFAIQMGGACARMGPMSGRCSLEHFAVHDGRIYVFASEACRAGFLAAPERHLDVAEPPLAGSAEDVARGRELVALALRGLGGAAAVDAVRTLTLERSGPRESDGRTYQTRETLVWSLPDGLRSESAWDDWVYVRSLAPEGAFQGSGEPQPMTPAAAAEFRRTMAREPLHLLRQREAPDWEAVAAGSEQIAGVQALHLRVRVGGDVTSLFLHPEDGRVLRTAWHGRLDSGERGALVVDHSDHRVASGVAISHARAVSFEGVAADEPSRPFTRVAVDAPASAEPPGAGPR